MTYTNGPKYHAVCPTEEAGESISPLQKRLRAISVFQTSSPDRAWLRGCAPPADWRGVGARSEGKQASMRVPAVTRQYCLPPGHALDVLSIRKICPFPRWISAHLCPKTVPHAFLCMWTWQSSANHQQDVSFVFPMWWAIPTFTHFPCKNRTSPWLVRIRDVAVAKEKFSSVEVNPWGGLNPETRVNSNVL